MKYQHKSPPTDIKKLSPPQTSRINKIRRRLIELHSSHNKHKKRIHKSKFVNKNLRKNVKKKIFLYLILKFLGQC